MRGSRVVDDVVCAPAQHMTVDELYAHVPHFDARRDPQAGDWVLVTPARRTALLPPLVSALETGSCACDASGTAHTRVRRLPLAAFAQPSPQQEQQQHTTSVVPLADAAATTTTHAVELAPLSRAYALFASEAYVDDTHGSTAAAAARRVLYLHVRLALLTPTPPCVFGGHRDDVVLALLQQPQSSSSSDGVATGGDAAALYVAPLSLRMGCVLDAKSLSASLSTYSVTPRWAAAIEAAARADWAAWQARERRANATTRDDADT